MSEMKAGLLLSDRQGSPVFFFSGGLSGKSEKCRTFAADSKQTIHHEE